LKRDSRENNHGALGKTDHAPHVNIVLFRTLRSRPTPIFGHVAAAADRSDAPTFAKQA
jgi:hypothetical protein